MQCIFCTFESLYQVKMCIHEEEFKIDFSKKKFWKTFFFVGSLTTNFDMEISIVCFSSHDELQYDGA